MKVKAIKNNAKSKKKPTKSVAAETVIKPPRVAKEKAISFEMSDADRTIFVLVKTALRKDADNTFEIGAGLSVLQPSIPEKSWGKVIRPLGLTTRSAWNYMSVTRFLGVYRSDLVEADIGRTVLYQLARAPEALVAVVLEAYHRGERLGVAAVKGLADEVLGVGKKEKAAATQSRWLVRHSQSGDAKTQREQRQVDRDRQACSCGDRRSHRGHA